MPIAFDGDLLVDMRRIVRHGDIASQANRVAIAGIHNGIGQLPIVRHQEIGVGRVVACRVRFALELNRADVASLAMWTVIAQLVGVRASRVSGCVDSRAGCQERGSSRSSCRSLPPSRRAWDRACMPVSSRQEPSLMMLFRLSARSISLTQSPPSLSARMELRRLTLLASSSTNMPPPDSSASLPREREIAQRRRADKPQCAAFVCGIAADAAAADACLAPVVNRAAVFSGIAAEAAVADACLAPVGNRATAAVVCEIAAEAAVADACLALVVNRAAAAACGIADEAAVADA